jgi:hypothetical protein
LGKTVEELLDNMSSYELTEWMAYYKAKREMEEEAMKEAERKRK